MPDVGAENRPQPGAEGTYLLVNKNVVEAAAVVAVLSFRTGAIAGLDLLWSSRRGRMVPHQPARAGEV